MLTQYYITMKKVFLVALMLGLGITAMAQQPTIAGSGKIEAGKKDSRIKVLQPENMVLKPGEENVIKISVDGIDSKQLIVKNTDDNIATSKRGDEFGSYIVTPIAKEGIVHLRIGYMDFMASYVHVGDLDFFIGDPAKAQAAAKTETPAQTTIAMSNKIEAGKKDSRIKILEPENMMLKSGVENVIKITIDGVESKQMVVKNTDDNIATSKRGEEFGSYIVTPIAKEGTVHLRIGYMDFMGCFVHVGDVDFTITAE